MPSQYSNMKRQKSIVNYCSENKRNRRDRTTSSGTSIGSTSSVKPTSDSELPSERQDHDLSDEDTDVPVSFSF